MDYYIKIDGRVFYMTSQNGENVEVEFAEDFLPEILRDFDNRILRTKANTTLRFRGSAREFLEDIMADSECLNLDAELFGRKCGDDWDIKWSGTIIPFEGRQVRQSDDGRYVEFELLDNEFQSLLLKRWELEVDLGSSYSLACAFIGSPQRYSTTYYDTQGNVRAGTSVSWRVFEVFEHLTNFMFDGDVVFKSSFIENLDLHVTTGVSMRTQEFAVLGFQNFKKLFDELYVQYNLWIGFENGCLVIEPESYFREQEVLKTFDCLTNFSSERDISRVYGKVKTGSNETLSRAQGGSFNTDRYNFTWKEEFHNISPCSNGNELTLVNSYIIGSNVIHLILDDIDGSDNYDEDYVLVEVETTGDVTANALMFTQYTEIEGAFGSTSPAVRYYNENLMNYFKLERWFCGLTIDNPDGDGIFVRATAPISRSGTAGGGPVNPIFQFPLPGPNYEIVYADGVEYIPGGCG